MSTIRVFSSRRCALTVVLSSPSSIHMNVITSSRVISFYPQLSLAGRSLVREGQDLEEVRSSTDPSVQHSASNNDWNEKCGVYCPAIRRKTYGDVGIAQYCWSQTLLPLTTPLFPYPHEDTSPCNADELLLQEHVEWTLAKRCSNRFCPVSLDHDVISQYIYL